MILQYVGKLLTLILNEKFLYLSLKSVWMVKKCSVYDKHT